MEESAELRRALDRVHPERKLFRVIRAVWEARVWIAGSSVVAWAFWQLAKWG